MIDKVHDQLRMKVTENMLGITRIRFQNINLKSLRHDILLIPNPQKQQNEDLNLAKASLLNSKIGRNECRIYRTSLVDFQKQKTKALNDITNFQNKMDMLNKDIIITANRIKALNWKGNDLKQESFLKSLDQQLILVEEEITRHEKYIHELQMEAKARESCNGAVQIGLEYKKVNEEIVITIHSAVELVADDNK